MGEVDEVRGTQLFFFIWKSVRKCQTSSELEVDLEVDLEVWNLGTVLTSTFIRSKDSCITRRSLHNASTGPPLDHLRLWLDIYNFSI